MFVTNTKVGRVDVFTDGRLIDPPPSLSNCFGRGLDGVSFYKVCTSKLHSYWLPHTDVLACGCAWICVCAAVLQMHENSQLLIKTSSRLTGPSPVRAAMQSVGFREPG